jgi:hypothetical protein
MNLILLYSDHRHVSAGHVAIFRLVNAKNTDIFIVCRDHSTVKNDIVVVQIMVNW